MEEEAVEEVVEIVMAVEVEMEVPVMAHSDPGK